jgi:nucleoid DNA-binding protein
MKKSDLIFELKKIGLTYERSKLIVDSVIADIQNALNSGDTINISGFGSLIWKSRYARIARNPKTGKLVQLNNRQILQFKPSARLKKKINLKDS